MMTVDVSELIDLQYKLKNLPDNLTRKETTLKALKKACKPCLNVMKANTPDSGEMPYIPKKYAGDLAYQRGGHALRNAARIRATKFKKNRETQVLVGYSKAKGKAGWRAHFIEHGWVHHESGRFIPGRPWIRPAEEFTAPLVERLFETEMKREIDKLF